MVRYLMFDRHTSDGLSGDKNKLPYPSLASSSSSSPLSLCGTSKFTSTEPSEGLYPAINRNYYNPNFFSSRQSMLVKPRENVLVILNSSDKLYKYYGFVDEFVELTNKQMALMVTNLHSTKHVEITENMLLDHLLSHPFVDSHFCSVLQFDIGCTEIFHYYDQHQKEITHVTSCNTNNEPLIFCRNKRQKSYSVSTDDGLTHRLSDINEEDEEEDEQQKKNFCLPQKDFKPMEDDETEYNSDNQCFESIVY
jgi:hypothetical protein